MTLRNVALAVAVGSPLFALYILGALLLLDMDSAPGQYALAVPVALFLGAVPWGFLLSQAIAGGKQGDDAALPGWLPAGVAVLDAWKGALGVALGSVVVGAEVGAMAAGLAVLTGHVGSACWSRVGRGGPVLVGGLLAMAPVAGAVALAAVLPAILAQRRGLPGEVLVGLAALLATLLLALFDQTHYAHLGFVAPASVLTTWQGWRRPEGP